MKNGAGVLGLVMALYAVTAFAAAEPTAEQIEFFEVKIRPLFADNCYSCHSAKEKIKGDLRLDVPAKILTGGHSGPAIVPGDADASLLIKAVRYADEDLQMPPDDKKLAAEQIALLETWVKMGAAMPKTSCRQVSSSIIEPSDERARSFIGAAGLHRGRRGVVA